MGSSWSSDPGGHAGIARSVGGSGGHMSVSCGGAGAVADEGGHVDFLASAATDFGGSVIGASPLSSSIASPGEVGTVWAHSGVAFLTGTGPTNPFSVSAPGSVSVQSGSPFCMGSAGSASSSARSWGGWLLSAGVTGTVPDQTGFVSRVGTAGTGSLVASSGGVESLDAEESLSKSPSV